MKNLFFKYSFGALILMMFSGLQSSSQNLTGIWKGYFISDVGEYYKLEFQVAQNSTYGVTGVSYSYLDVRFYGKASMTGSFIKSSSSFRIREIKTVEVKSTLGGATCIMNYNFTYSKSGKEEFLEGSYLGKFETKNLAKSGEWGDCGGGKVYLRKVTTSDFYIEPFLRNKINTKPVLINVSPVRKDTAKSKSIPAITKKPPVVSKPITKTVTKPPVSKTVTSTKPVIKTTNPPVAKIKIDSVKTKVDIPVITTPPTILIPRPEVLKSRTNELVKVLTVNDPEVTIKLYDNGEIDGDTISVYHNNKKVISSKRLTATPLIVKLELENENTEHELVMVAENLGRIPPNTSLMIVEAGLQRFDVRITSTEQKNAVVKFIYRKTK
ncbi:MAG: hypothetical protein WBC06_07650 [Chitinophagaceae bacterium]